MAAGGALVRRGGSSARVGTANDGPLEAGKRGNSMSVRAAKSTATSDQLFSIADKQLAKCLLGMQMRNSKNVVMYATATPGIKVASFHRSSAVS